MLAMPITVDHSSAGVAGEASSTRLWRAAVTRTARALSEFRIEGVATNIPFLQNVLAHPDFVAGRIYTRFVDDHIAELVDSGGVFHPLAWSARQAFRFLTDVPSFESSGVVVKVPVHA